MKPIHPSLNAKNYRIKYHNIFQEMILTMGVESEEKGEPDF
jgi:hypothetical protein